MYSVAPTGLGVYISLWVYIYRYVFIMDVEFTAVEKFWVVTSVGGYLTCFFFSCWIRWWGRERERSKIKIIITASGGSFLYIVWTSLSHSLGYSCVWFFYLSSPLSDSLKFFRGGSNSKWINIHATLKKLSSLFIGVVEERAAAAAVGRHALPTLFSSRF